MHALLDATNKIRFKRTHAKLAFRGGIDQLHDVQD